MTHIVNLAQLPPVLPGRGLSAKQAEQAGDDRDGPDAHAPALRKSALMLALDMNDDLSGLVSSMRRTRQREERASDIQSQAWLEHVLDEQAPTKYELVCRQLRHGLASDLAGLRQLLLGQFDDPSDIVAVLRGLLCDDELQELHDRLEQLQQEFLAGGEARQVQAGLNMALKARLHGSKMRVLPQQLRCTYQSFLASQDPLDSYEAWISCYGLDKRHLVLDFIEQSLAADMYALDPSCSRLEFGELLHRVRQLANLRSTDHLLLRHCWKPPIMEAMGIDQLALLKALFGVVRDGGGLRHLFRGLLAPARFVLDAPQKSMLAQGFWRFLKELPQGLWPDADLQVQAIEEVERMLDRAFAMERHATAAQRVQA